MAHVPHLIPWRRLLRWTAFGLLLASIGAVLYVVLPSAPRWRLTGTVRTFLTDDESLLATCARRGETSCGPVQLWDIATGTELEQLLADEPIFLAEGVSHDGRYFVAVLPGAGPGVQRIATVDLQTRRVSQVEAALGVFTTARFSRTCNYLAVRQHKVGVAQASYALAETTTGRVVARFENPCRTPTRQDDLRGWPDSADDGLFTDDGRYFAINQSGDAARALHLFDLQTGKATLLAKARVRAFAPDSRSLIADRDGTTWIWDLAAMAWRTPLKAGAPDTLRFSADGRWLASVPPKKKQPVALRFFDLRTGWLHWEFKSITCNSEEMQEERFSPDSRCFLLPTEPAPGQRRLAMYDVEAKQQLWERTAPANFGTCLFTSDSRTLISALPSRVEVINVAIGATRYTIDMPQSVGVDPWLSRDGQTLYVLRQPGPPEPTFWNDLWEEHWPWPHNDLETAQFPLHGYDLASGRELWRQQTQFADAICFAADGIVTLHHRRDGDGPPTSTTITCWDAPPRKRFGWIIGIPVGIGVLLLSASAGWRRIRRRAAGRQAPHGLRDAKQRADAPPALASPGDPALLEPRASDVLRPRP